MSVVTGQCVIWGRSIEIFVEAKLYLISHVIMQCDGVLTHWSVFVNHLPENFFYSFTRSHILLLDKLVTSPVGNPLSLLMIWVYGY